MPQFGGSSKPSYQHSWISVESAGQRADVFHRQAVVATQELCPQGTVAAKDARKAKGLLQRVRDITLTKAVGLSGFRAGVVSGH